MGKPSLGRIGHTVGALIALLALAVTALTVAGCGGGGGSGSASESSLRKQLEAGAAKLTAAKSFRVEVPITTETEGETEELGCIKLAIDTIAKVERFDLLYFDQNCSGGTEAHELIAIGHQAWASTGPGTWRAATITKSALDELDNEQTDLEGLFKAAEDIHQIPGGGAVEEGESNYVDVPSYTFEAPASALPNSDEDLGDLKIDFEAVLDKKGFLREVTLEGSEEEFGAKVSDIYTDVDQPLGITPPDPSEVKGSKTKIRSQADLERLFDFPST